MFGLGMPEILMILAIALIVIGPKKLPDLAKTLGRAMGEFKRSAQDFKRSIDVETTVKDIKDVADPNIDLKDIIKDVNTEDKKPSDEKNESAPPDDNQDGQDGNDEDPTSDKPSDKNNNTSDSTKNE